MNNINHKFGTFLFLLAILTGCSKQEKAGKLPSNDTIRALVDESVGIYGVPLGRLIVHNHEDDFSNKKISQDCFIRMKSVADAGLIEIHSNEILGENTQFTWDDWNRRMVQGQMLDIRVELTEKGRKLDSSVNVKERSSDWAYHRLYDQKVDDIVSMELQKMAGSNYCIVNAMVLEEMTQAGVEVFGASELDRPKKTRYKVTWLLKHDPFEKAWKVIAMDSATEGQDINSNNVNQALLNAK